MWLKIYITKEIIIQPNKQQQDE